MDITDVTWYLPAISIPNELQSRDNDKKIGYISTLVVKARILLMLAFVVV